MFNPLAYRARAKPSPADSGLFIVSDVGDPNMGNKERHQPCKLEVRKDKNFGSGESTTGDSCPAQIYTLITPTVTALEKLPSVVTAIKSSSQSSLIDC